MPTEEKQQIVPGTEKEKEKVPFEKKLKREIIAWLWVGLIFFLINGAVGQARVIPSGSMENTLLVGDHLIMSRLGYDIGVPFTNWHMPLWRNPHRQQIIIFQPPFDPNAPNYVKRVIGIPGDTVEIHDGAVRFVSSPCAGKLCVHAGWLKNGNDFTACLPNRVSIAVIGGSEGYDSVNF